MNRREQRQAKSIARRRQVGGRGPVAASHLREAIALLQAGLLLEAEAAYRRVLASSPNHALAHHHLGLVRFKLGYKSEAVDLIRRSLQVAPDDAKAWLNLAVILSDLGCYSEAKTACAESLIRDANVAETLKVKGDIHRAMGEYAAAVAAYDSALRLDPMSEVLCLRRAMALADASTKGATEQPEQMEEALEALKRARNLQPKNSKLHFELATLLDKMGRTEQAFEASKIALDLSPDNAAGYAGLGQILRKIELYEGAITAFEEAVRLDPSLLAAYHNLAVTQRLLGRFEDARRNFEAVLSSDPEALLTRIELAYMRRVICDWKGLEVEEEDCLRQMRACGEVIPPFILIAMEASPADQLEAARRYAQKTAAPRPNRFRHNANRFNRSDRLKLGYLSSDFNNHATSLLLAETFELHDRSRFDVIGYSFGADDGSDLRRRVSGAFDRFVEIGQLGHREAARTIFGDGIDILVDLNGFTRHSRPEIASHCPAPIQVNYLGYPGTMGADYMDYVIADAVTVPAGAEVGFSEKIVRLSGCYQPNDRRRAIAQQRFSRSDAGLPDDGFVFCCFNGSWKINRSVFDVWMRLLDKTPGSVLWLLSSNQATRLNLENEALARGIAPDRLVFAPIVSNAQHLARHALADLFLDCIPCNAHTTASDALWAGLPLLTLTGKTFASRVAASLLHAVGLQELVASTLSEYEQLALVLARDKDMLQRIRGGLISGRDGLELFDAQTYTRRLEAAFESMVQDYLTRTLGA